MFSEKIDVQDPITGSLEKKHLKPFMVNQLSILIERGNLILSPYDKHLYKQLIDYRVEKVSAAGVPVYTDKNEHFVDALGLAYLAFVEHFPELTKLVKKSNPKNVIQISHNNPLPVFNKSTIDNPWAGVQKSYESADEAWQQVPLNTPFNRPNKRTTGRRNNFTRSLF